MTKLSVLDLFSGTGGWSQAFLDRGHNILRIDNDEQFLHVPFTSIEDVLTFRPREKYDVVLASPPCQAFSLAATGTHMAAVSHCRMCGGELVKTHERWGHTEINKCGLPRDDGSLFLRPKTDFGKLSVRLVEHTLELIDIIRPSYWWMENPNGGMIHFVPDSIPRVQTTYCQYGETRQKLTNLWGDWPGIWEQDYNNGQRGKSHPLYANFHQTRGWRPRPRCKNGASCHVASHCGDKTGTQGIKGAVARAIVPYELSLEVCLAIENSMDG